MNRGELITVVEQAAGITRQQAAWALAAVDETALAGLIDVILAGRVCFWIDPNPSLVVRPLAAMIGKPKGISARARRRLRECGDGQLKQGPI